MKNLLRLLSELKRRRVYQVTAAYAVASFALLEAADLVLPVVPAPPWTYKALVIMVLAGFPVAVALSWIFDITPEGIRREGASEGPSPEPDGRGWKGRSLLVGTVVVGLVGVGAWVAGRKSAGLPRVEGSSTLAVLPFSSAAPDSALQRVGRELAITLSSSLAATADLATVEPLAVLARVPQDAAPLSLEEAREIAASLGAASFLQGAILGGRGDYRVELALHETGDLRRLGSQTVEARRMDALTDSATVAVLRMIWDDAPSAPPSPGAISTGNLEALQAYLAGERAIASGRWREAPEHFSRAIDADSTFWFAYWRLEYSLSYHGSPVDSLVRARVREHRQEFPTRDRLLIESRAETGSRRLEALRDATVRFPNYWPAWWELADFLVHSGGYLGHTVSDSRAVLERTLSLNPRMVSAWSHLFWMATSSRDTSAMADIVSELSDVRYDQVSLREAGINSLTYYEALLTLAEAGGEPPPEIIEEGVSELASYRGPNDPAMVANGLINMGFPEAQIVLSQALLRSDESSRAMKRAQHLILAHAWAAVGDWDSALAAADAFGSSAVSPGDLLLPYQIAVMGLWTGALDPAEAVSRRPRVDGGSFEEGDLADQVAWLSGLAGFLTGNRDQVARARGDLASGEGRWSATLDESMAAFEEAMAGDTTAAARGLADLEMALAEEGSFRSAGAMHPFMSAVQRLTAAEWLLVRGDTLTARRLLPWHEAVSPGAFFRLSLANQLFAPRARALQERLAEG